MLGRGLISLLLIFSVIFLSYGKIENIGKYLKTCSRSSPDANKCILEAVRTGLPILCDGIPEINYPPMDPYHQNEVSGNYNNNQDKQATSRFNEGNLCRLDINILRCSAAEETTSSLKTRSRLLRGYTRLVVVPEIEIRFYFKPFPHPDLRSAINIKMTMNDIYVYHLKKSNVKDARLRADEDRFHLEIDMFSPKVFVKGKYVASGSYNALKVEANGVFNVSMRDLTYTWKLDGEPETKDGETYMRIKSFYMSPDVKEMKASLTNENPDTQSLTEFAINFTNENWRPVYRELLPLARADWNKTGIRFSNKIFLKVPYDQLFTP